MRSRQVQNLHNRDRSVTSLLRLIALRLIYEMPLTRNGFGTSGIGDADELFDELAVLVVVPVTENNGEFFVVALDFLGGVDDEWGAETVDVLALWIPGELGMRNDRDEVY